MRSSEYFDTKMVLAFPRTAAYLKSIDVDRSDALDLIVWEMMLDKKKFEELADALGRKFRHGRGEVPAWDRGERKTVVRRQAGGADKYRYFVLGADGNWGELEERVWVVGMVELYKKRKAI